MQALTVTEGSYLRAASTPSSGFHIECASAKNRQAEARELYMTAKRYLPGHENG